MENEPQTYRDKIRVCWNEASEANAKAGGEPGASAADVTDLMSQKGWLSPMDTVIDIADIMREMFVQPS